MKIPRHACAGGDGHSFYAPHWNGRWLVQCCDCDWFRWEADG